MMSKSTRRVYSTDQGRLCPSCEQPQHEGKCSNDTILGDGKVRISRETKGRKGAGVTLVKGIPLAENDLKALHKKLKKRCSVGGAIKSGVMEFQGDQRELLFTLLKVYPWDVKISGS